MSQQINLYEERLRPRVDLATGKNLGIAAVIALALVSAVAWWSKSDADRKTAVAEVTQKELQAAQDRLKEVSLAVSQRKVSPALAAELEGARAKLSARQEVIDVLSSGRLGNANGFSAFMTGFAQQASADLWLTGFRIAEGGDEIEIRGRVLDPSLLPGYVQRLNSVPVLQGRRFATLDMQSVVPEALAVSAELAGATKTAGTATPAAASAQLPPFVEFALRSARMGDDADKGKAAP